VCAAPRAGQALGPREAHWLTEYLHELTTFPNGKHDDQVDSTSQALGWGKQRKSRWSILEYYRSRSSTRPSRRPIFSDGLAGHGPSPIEGSHQLALAMAVPMASPRNRAAAYAGFAKPRPLITVPPQRSVEFCFQEFLDEAANAGPHPGFQGIKPIQGKAFVRPLPPSLL
jgi:hypothetical protein